MRLRTLIDLIRRGAVTIFTGCFFASCQLAFNRPAYGPLPLSVLPMNVSRFAGLLIIALLSACDAQQPPVPKPKTETPASAPQAAADAPVAPVQALPSVAVAPVVEAEVEQTPVAKVAPTVEDQAPVHELKPNVPVVPVVAAKSAPVKASPIKEAQVKADALKLPAPKATSQASTATLKREPVVNKSKPAREVVKDTRLSQPKLDLSLPPELVQQMTPPKGVITAPHKPILPPMFSTKDASDKEAFQLNGRLLSNEMQLQMRNNDRHEIEGAALDFKFKQ